MLDCLVEFALMTLAILVLIAVISWAVGGLADD